MAAAEFSRPAGGGAAKARRKGKKSHKTKNSGGFESLGLGPKVYGGIKRKGYKVPTPIQRKTIPLILSGSDLVAMARTGSGKTAAFLVPMLQRLQCHLPQAGVRALILSPTRDLAMQTLKFTKELGHFTDLRTSLLVGGDSMENQFEELANSPDVIIATPGRLMHHLAEVEGMSLRTVEYVVFDEADSLFGMGFAEQLHRILVQLSESRQTLLFSATLPSAVAEFARAGLRDPQVVRLDLETKISPDLKMAFFTLRQEEKSSALLHLVREMISSDQQTLIFVSTKHHVELLHLLFEKEGLASSICYGDMDQDARKIHISKFRSRSTMLLIVTDIAARGIDIPLLDNVVNLDFPAKPKIFVHRVGRAARAGRTGTAYSFITSEDMPYLLDLHLFLSKPLRPAPTEDEYLNDMGGISSKIDESLGKGETVYGCFPQVTLDLLSDRIHETVRGCEDLISLQKVCANAFGKYLKSKPPPSRESIRRVKKMSREGLHPIFKTSLGSNELTALAFSEHLKAFRPKQTILEAAPEAVKAKHSQTSSQFLDVMRKKRSIHDGVIKLECEKKLSHQELKELEPEAQTAKVSERKYVCGMKRKYTTFKDEEYYISSMPSNKHLEAGLSVRENQGFGANRLEAAVLDLDPDDTSTLQKQKVVHHWDKRKKKFIKLDNGDRVTSTGKIKTESGAKVKASKPFIYKKWTERSHKTISLNGTSTMDTGRDINLSDHRPRGGRHIKSGRNHRSTPNVNAASELKDPEHVRKNRQQKATKFSHMKNNSKGKRFGNKQKGKRGKGKIIRGHK